jgi:hypothetical protein
MTNAACRLVVPPCAFLVLLLVGSPDFTAVERAMSKAFVTHTDWRAVAASAAAPALSQGTSAPRLPLSVADPAASIEGPSPAAVASAEPDAAAPHRADGPGLLVPLYVSFATLQALDLHSTFYAIHRGASEANPVMASLVEHPVAFAALKAGTAAGIIFMTDRLRRHSRVGAIVMMAAFNSAYAVVVARNYRLGNRAAR